MSLYEQCNTRIPLALQSCLVKPSLSQQSMELLRAQVMQTLVHKSRCDAVAIPYSRCGWKHIETRLLCSNVLRAHLIVLSAFICAHVHK